MKNDISTLPDDPAELKQIIASMQRRYQSEIDLLHEQIRHLYNKFFGRKSEVVGPNPQLPLFDMPEPDPEPAKKEDSVDVPAHTRKKAGRKTLPAELPRVEIIHDIPEEEKICDCGAPLCRIGEEVAEKLDIIPAIIRVIKHVRPKYSCKSCEGVDSGGPTVRIAPVPPQIIPKGIAGGGLLAHIITAKFEDALPFYRQEKQFARLGVEIGRATMCNWAMKTAQACSPLLTLLKKEILSGPLINVDETTVQVLEEPGRSPTTKSYMWIFRGGDPQKPALLFHYHPTRAGEVASSLLKDYHGAVQTDGFSGYDFLDSRASIVHIGCWAHARRKFVEADKARGKNDKPGSTTIAINFIREIYVMEKRAARNNLSGEQLLAFRQVEIKPIVEKFRVWLEKKSLHVVPKSLLGKAIAYTLNQWHRLVAYLEVGFATPDNNLAENAIRPFVVGRKNWLFAGTVEGAQASAALYSLIETAKANRLDAYAYLRFLFEKLPFAGSEEEYMRLLPQNVTRDQMVLPANWSVV